MTITIQENISLRDYITMKVGGDARYLTEASNEAELREAIQWASARDIEFMVLGGGSNTIFTDDGYDGLVIINKSNGISFEGNTVTVQAGTNWDELVAETVRLGFSGIECLSAIPGSCGAAPIQNIGAYGQELANSFVSLRAYDRNEETTVELGKESCQFGYRRSIFNTTEIGRYVIFEITLALSTLPIEGELYAGLQKYIDEHFSELSSEEQRTPQRIRDAVIAVRESKLPDPAKLANTGSFFKNPIINSSQFAELQEKYPEIVGFEVSPEQTKVPAGWLLEQAGFKNMEPKNGIGTAPNHALVLVNYGTDSYEDLATTMQTMQQTVQDKFGIALSVEPNIIS